MAQKPIGDALVDAGLLAPEQLQRALTHQRLTGRRLIDCLVELKLVEEKELLRIRAAGSGTRYVPSDRLAQLALDPSTLERIPVRVAERETVLPISFDTETQCLTLLSITPRDTELIEEIQRVAQVKDVHALAATRWAIECGIRKHYYGEKDAFERRPHDTDVVAEEPPPPTPIVKSRSRSRSSSTGDTVITSGAGMPAYAGGPSSQTIVGSPSSSTPVSADVSTAVRDRIGFVRPALDGDEFLAALEILVGIAEQSRSELRGHSNELARVCGMMAQALGMSARETRLVQVAALLHSVGVELHPHVTVANLDRAHVGRTAVAKMGRVAAEMFARARLPRDVASILAERFEAFDGSGRPRGIQGGEICRPARILALADSYLDLTRNRSNLHGALLSPREALHVLAGELRARFDPELFPTLSSLVSGELVRARLRAAGRQMILAVPEEVDREALRDECRRNDVVVHAVGELDGLMDAVLAGWTDLVAIAGTFGADTIVDIGEFTRRQPEARDLPIVALGRFSADDQVRLRRAGVTRIFDEAVSFEALARRLAALCVESEQRGAPRRSVEGALEEVPMFEVVAILSALSKTGRITARSAGRIGVLYLDEGHATYCAFGKRVSDDAYDELLKLDRGEFKFDPRAALEEEPNMDRAPPEGD